MDRMRFDNLARALASRTTRRGAVQAASVAGVGAVVATTVADSASAQTSRRVVTCEWKIEAEISSGPNTGDRYDGWLTLEIDRDGYIDYASLELDVPDVPRPVYEGVGMANGRSVDFRLEGGDCDVLAFTGVGTEEIRSCEGLLEGSFQGPRLIDLGGWRTSLDEICEEGEVWSDEICGCEPDDCEPKTCPSGEEWCRPLCRCACAAEPCRSGEVWSYANCECQPEDSCPDVTCESWELLEPSSCRCYCPAQDCQNYDSPRVWDYDKCSCVCAPQEWCGIPYEWDSEECVCSCPSDPCPNGGYRDMYSCECICQEQYCPPGSWLDQESCQCICEVGTLCGDLQTWCADLTQDDYNCGACGNTCPEYTKCRGGVCAA